VNNGQVQSNTNSFFGIKVSVPGVNVNNATDSQLQYLNNYSQEVFFANGLANTLVGSRVANSINGLSTSEEGFFVAQQGIDVRNATDRQLVFNSGNDVLQIIATGNVETSLSFSNQSATVTVPHNLGYIPASLVYCQISTNINSLPSETTIPAYSGNFVQTPFNLFGLNGSGGLGLLSSIFTESDTTNIYISTQQQFFDGSTVYNYTCAYYIMSESINP
jgi:hypothetical protein